MTKRQKTTDIGTLLNLACIKYTGQSLPNCGDELPTEWKYKLVDGKRIAVQQKPSPLTLRPSSNSSIELDIKRMMIVSDLKSIFNFKKEEEERKTWLRDISTPSLRKMGFTDEEISIGRQNIDGFAKNTDKSNQLLVWYKIGIPYNSKGVQKYLELGKPRYRGALMEELCVPPSKRSQDRNLIHHYTEQADYTGRTDDFKAAERRIWWGTLRHQRLRRPEWEKRNGDVKKAKKFQMEFINQRVSILPINRQKSASDFGGGGGPLTWSGFDWSNFPDGYQPRYGREWMDEGKLDTKTLLRVYADKRESYEDVVNRICF